MSKVWPLEKKVIMRFLFRFVSKKCDNFTLLFWRGGSGTVLKVCAARAARLFFAIRPIKFIICGVVISVAVVYAKARFSV